MRGTRIRYWRASNSYLRCNWVPWYDSAWDQTGCDRCSKWSRISCVLPQKVSYSYKFVRRWEEFSLSTFYCRAPTGRCCHHVFLTMLVGHRLQECAERIVCREFIRVRTLWPVHLITLQTVPQTEIICVSIGNVAKTWHLGWYYVISTAVFTPNIFSVIIPQTWECGEDTDRQLVSPNIIKIIRVL